MEDVIDEPGPPSPEPKPPTVLPEDLDDQWMDPRFEDVEPLKHLLVPAANDALIATPVSQRVNSVKNDDPDCLTPGELPESQRALF